MSARESQNTSPDVAVPDANPDTNPNTNPNTSPATNPGTNPDTQPGDAAPDLIASLRRLHKQRDSVLKSMFDLSAASRANNVDMSAEIRKADDALAAIEVMGFAIERQAGTSPETFQRLMTDRARRHMELAEFKHSLKSLVEVVGAHRFQVRMVGQQGTELVDYQIEELLVQIFSILKRWVLKD